MGQALRKVDDTLWGIKINTNGQVPTSANADIQMANGDSVQFTNNAGYPITIHFTTSSGAVFNSIVGLASGATSEPQTAQQQNVTVNYTILNINANQTSSPYGIEVGSGPLRINIAGAQPQPKVISIPNGGSIQFNSDAAYNIVWTPPNVFNPNPNQVEQGLNPVMTEVANQLNSATYTLVSFSLTRGGGTVKIGS